MNVVIPPTFLAASFRPTAKYCLSTCKLVVFWVLVRLFWPVILAPEDRCPPTEEQSPISSALSLGPESCWMWSCYKDESTLWNSLSELSHWVAILNSLLFLVIWIIRDEAGKEGSCEGELTNFGYICSSNLPTAVPVTFLPGIGNDVFGNSSSVMTCKFLQACCSTDDNESSVFFWSKAFLQLRGKKNSRTKSAFPV